MSDSKQKCHHRHTSMVFQDHGFLADGLLSSVCLYILQNTSDSCTLMTPNKSGIKRKIPVIFSILESFQKLLNTVDKI